MPKNFFVHITDEGSESGTPTQGAAVCLQGQDLGPEGDTQGCSGRWDCQHLWVPHQTSEFPAGMIPSFTDSKIAVILVYKQLGEWVRIENAEVFHSSI